MPKIDVSQFKQSLSAVKEGRRKYSKTLREADLSERSQRLKNRQAVGQVLEPFLTKAGLDVEKLNKILAENQSELRRNFQKQKVEASKHLPSERDAFRHAIDLGRKASEYLANRPPAVGFDLSSLISLTTPFLIWEWPHATPDQLRDYKIEPLNSYAKILIDIPAYSFDDDSGSATREFSFYFFWENQSEFLAVAKAFSVLSLNGACEVAANSGIFSGDHMQLSIDAWLYPVTYWLPLPPGGDITDLRLRGDPLQHQKVLDLSATGGHIFGGADFESKMFSANSYGLSYGSYGGFQIPAWATVLFEVNLTIGYSYQGNSLPDEIVADFADNNLDYYVGCPIVVLQLLTAPPSMV